MDSQKALIEQIQKEQEAARLINSRLKELRELVKKLDSKIYSYSVDYLEFTKKIHVKVWNKETEKNEVLMNLDPDHDTLFSVTVLSLDALLAKQQVENGATLFGNLSLNS